MFKSKDKDALEWWERSWKEKERILSTAYGESDIQDVTAYDWDEIDLRIPGACAMEFGPNARNGSCHITLSFGLSQPIGPEAFQGIHAPSGDGYELAIATIGFQTWKVGLIGQLLTYVRQSSASLGRGHRLPVWFRDEENAMLGKPERGDTPFGEMRWIVLWPDLKNPGGFDSSTGYFNVYFCTTITTEEWGFAKTTSSAHLLLLLAESDITQISFLERDDVLAQRQNADRVRRISSLSVEQAEMELFERYRS